MTPAPAFVSNLFAVWLVLLAACPFTAPFSTCDIDNLSAHVNAAHASLHQGAPLKVKASHERLTAAAARMTAGSLFPAAGAASPVRRAPIVSSTPAQRTVLRL
jgi:hypothetical protein